MVPLAIPGVPLSAWLTLAARPIPASPRREEHALALLDPGGQPPGQVDAGDRAARVAGKEAALARVLAVGDDVLVAGEQADVERRGVGWRFLVRRRPDLRLDPDLHLQARPHP